MLASILLLSAASLVGFGPAAAEVVPGRVVVELRKYAGLSEQDIRKALREGALHAKIDTDADQEAASLHLVRVAVPVSFALREYPRPAVAMETASALQRGFLTGAEPAFGLEDLTLDQTDLRDLGKCRVGDCDLKLTGDWIRTLRTGIDWKTPAATREAMTLYRRLLAEFAGEYRRSGNGSLLRYEDKRRPVHSGVEFTGIVQESVQLCSELPALCTHLLDFPLETADGLEDDLIWTLDDVGTRRKVLTLTHRVLYSPADSDELVLAAKMIYANHYFESALSVTRLLPAGGGGATWILMVYRARIDMLHGWGLLHGKIRSGIRHAIAQRLERAKTDLESRWQAVAAR